MYPNSVPGEILRAGEEATNVLQPFPIPVPNKTVLIVSGWLCHFRRLFPDMAAALATVKSAVKRGAFWTKATAQLTKEEYRSIVQFRRAARDGLYLIIDMWPALKRSHNEYGAFQRYLWQAKKGKINHEDFRGVDIMLLRQLLEDYHKTRGPLTGFDMRWFYVMYAFFAVNLTWGAYQLYGLRALRKEVRSSMDARHTLFDKDYIEDGQPPPGSALKLPPSQHKRGW